jgi:asparagine synthase (glutamine-hydrolysing)
MCGICGKLMFDREATVSPDVLKRMADSLLHRGPDDEGYYLLGPIGLGFRRLAIIDLNTGHQPLSNEDGTIWIVFNGEIYNFQELRALLTSKGHVFRSKTDTEVIVHLDEEYGMDCLHTLRGMFSFAIWDSAREALILARDRIGIKPLYYRLADGFLSFGSEIKAILADSDVQPQIDPAMIARFLTFYYLPGEETLFTNIRKLPPGSYLLAHHGNIQIRQYWDLQFNQSSAAPGLARSQNRLVELLQETVNLHMISDVPVGFLLSGGVDSTAMLSFASAVSANPISSFTVGFAAPNVIDERPYARLAAEKFGTQHYEITISPQEFLEFLPRYVWHMEEPVCEPPAVALYYVSQLAKNHVKVLISGEGGDEAFAGYSNYRNLVWLERFKQLLGPTRTWAARSLRFLNQWLMSPKIAKYVPLFEPSLQDYYYSRTSTPFGFVGCNGGQLYSQDFADRLPQGASRDAVRRFTSNDPTRGTLETMLYVDTKTWLPDDLLVKADRMTMANSIELRVPFLDHRVLEFAASLPQHYKVRGVTTKYVVKKALAGRLPKQILARRKAGFPVPYEFWQRTALREWLRDILLDRQTLARGYFKKSGIEYLLSQNLDKGLYPKEVFCLAVLELWHRMFIDKFPRPLAHA